MLKADDSEQACIPAELQLADFCQLRQVEIGQKLPVKKGQNRARSKYLLNRGRFLPHLPTQAARF